MKLIVLDGDGGYLIPGPGMQLSAQEVTTAGESTRWQVRVRERPTHPDCASQVWVVSRHASRTEAVRALHVLAGSLEEA